ncbi:MAG: type II toxin-antitoxin system VapC family toxin [Coriobacteriia bacterium]
MSIQIVVDSCVAYKWFYRDDEPGLEAADALLQAHLDGHIILAAPTTLPVELCNTLRYSRLPEDQVLEILDLIDAANIMLYFTSNDRLKGATTLALRHNLPVYDALFLQLAEELECPLVTADSRAFAGIDTPVEIRLL